MTTNSKEYMREYQRQRRAKLKFLECNFDYHKMTNLDICIERVEHEIKGGSGMEEAELKRVLPHLESYKELKKKFKSLEKRLNPDPLQQEHKWRIDVLNKYKYKCVICDKAASSAHHIYSRIYCQKYNPKLEWDIRNGVAVCYEHHDDITKDGRKWFKK